MRRIHVLMFGCQIVLNLIFSVLLFYGLLGENAIFAFIYPGFAFIYLLADIFITTFTTDIIVYTFKDKVARIAAIILRDFLTIALLLCLLLYIGIDIITIWGTLCNALPKLSKIVIYDIIWQQRYLGEHIKI